MNSDIAQVSLSVLPRAPEGRSLDGVGTAGSALLHVLLLALMLSPILEMRSRARAAPPQVTVASLVSAPKAAAPATPPQPANPQAEREAVTPAPAPATKPVAEPTKPQPSSAATSASSAQPSPKASNDGDALEDVVGRIRDNWLMPPDASRNFRCRLRIDYAAGGRITALHFLQSCGTLTLDDSVKRAIWKTQSLPLPNAKRDAGSLDLEFTP